GRSPPGRRWRRSPRAEHVDLGHSVAREMMDGIEEDFLPGAWSLRNEPRSMHEVSEFHHSGRRECVDVLLADLALDLLHRYLGLRRRHVDLGRPPRVLGDEVV